jgi:hypothetical protein
MIDRVVSLFVAVSLALLVWLYARSRDQETLDHVPVPVQVNLTSPQAPETPEAQGREYSLEVTAPAEVLVSFTGPPTRLRELRGLLQREELRIELNYSIPPERRKEMRIAETLPVDATDLRLPPGVTAAMVPGRNHVRIVLRRLCERRLPVRFDHSLEPLGPVLIEPPTVLVRGPQEVLEHLSAIPTQPWVLPCATPAADGTPRPPPPASVPLVRELEGRLLRCEPATVCVRASTPPHKVYDLVDLPVHFLCPSAFPLRPRFKDDRAGKITLRLAGPPQEETPHVYAFVDLTGKHSPSPGLYDEPIQIQLPRGFTLVDTPAPPRSVAFELVPPDE